MKNPNKTALRYHEDHMASGQDEYFSVAEDGSLQINPEQRHWVEIHQKKIERLLAVRTTDCFVDLGCGEGFYTIPISQKTNLCLGLDFSHNALRILCRQQDFNPGKLE